MADSSGAALSRPDPRTMAKAKAGAKDEKPKKGPATAAPDGAAGEPAPAPFLDHLPLDSEPNKFALLRGTPWKGGERTKKRQRDREMDRNRDSEMERESEMEKDGERDRERNENMAEYQKVMKER